MKEFIDLYTKAIVRTDQEIHNLTYRPPAEMVASDIQVRLCDLNRDLNAYHEALTAFTKT